MFRASCVMAMSALYLSGPASAAIVSIPAAAFHVAAPSTQTLNAFPDLLKGKLQAAGMATLVAPIDFPVDGHTICRMTLVYEDKNGAENLKVRLLRKSAVSGVNADTAPIVMGQVSSVGSASVTSMTSTTSFAPNRIDELRSFYYLDTGFVNFNLNLIGVQLDVRSVCP